MGSRKLAVKQVPLDPEEWSEKQIYMQWKQFGNSFRLCVLPSTTLGAAKLFYSWWEGTQGNFDSFASRLNIAQHHFISNKNGLDWQNVNMYPELHLLWANYSTSNRRERKTSEAIQSRPQNSLRQFARFQRGDENVEQTCLRWDGVSPTSKCGV